MKTVCYLVQMIVGFFTTIFINVPIIQKIYDLLVFPVYHNHLSAGIVFFGICIHNILFIKFKHEENFDLKNYVSKYLTFELTIFITWGFAKLYSFFI